MQETQLTQQTTTRAAHAQYIEPAWMKIDITETSKHSFREILK